MPSSAATGSGRLPKRSSHLGLHRLHLRRLAQIRQPQVETHLQCAVVDIVVGDERANRQFDADGWAAGERRSWGERPASRAPAEHPREESKPTAFMLPEPAPSILPAPRISRSFHRDTEARAQFGRLEDGRAVVSPPRASASDPCYRENRRMPAAAPGPYATAQLIELRVREKKGRVVDDDRVGVGNIQPILDDCGADQHIRLARSEKSSMTCSSASSGI